MREELTMLQRDTMQKIKVLCVDDSALVRGLMTQIINSQPDMEVVATAPDPLVARDLIKLHNPDVLTLDIEMPRMDGLAFLEKLMRLRPMPVVMVSSLTERGGENTLRALELGAVDFVTKPKLGIRDGLLQSIELIADKIRIAARAKPRAMVPPSCPPASTGATTVVTRPMSGSEKLVAIGASTGGTEAIREVLQNLPAASPAILIAQHMPAGFTSSFARRLDASCRLRVREAVHGERVLPGHVYLAPGGDSHMRLGRSGAHYIIELEASEPVNRHRPSVDVLFNSVALAAGQNAIGVLLTGMGKDGATGLLAMHHAGAHTIVQDEATCVVFGMPREAIALGAANEVVSLNAISERILTRLSAGGHRA